MTKELSNAQRNAAIEAIKAAKSVAGADNKLAARAADLLDAGITAPMIGKGGDYLAAFQHVAAETTLTEKQFETWGDTSLAQGKSVNGKRVDTPRGKLVKQVNAIVARVRNKLKEPVKTGAQGQRRSMDQMIAETCDKWIKRITENKDKETFNFGDADPIAVRKALQDVIATFKG